MQLTKIVFKYLTPPPPPWTNCLDLCMLKSLTRALMIEDQIVYLLHESVTYHLEGPGVIHDIFMCQWGELATDVHRVSCVQTADQHVLMICF